MKTVILVFSCLMLICQSMRDHPRFSSTPIQSPDPTHPKVFDQKQLWFDQLTDHFDYQTAKTWKQRYWVIDNYFNPKVGPVFLFICGEYTCQGVPAARQWVVTMAQRLQGLILVLQHRFYGQSLPFGNSSFSLEHLTLLNSEQALKDLAYFLDKVTTTNMHKVTNSPWISIGGSYPGALSAWFRYKYPHLTIGAIASSAVINAIADFKQFDAQMYNSSARSSEACAKAINDSSILVESKLASPDGAAFKAQFQGGDKLSDDEFLFFWVDSIVGEIQYGKRTNLCASLDKKTPQQQFQVLIALAKTNDVDEYGSYYLKNQTYAVQNGAGSRSWLFQCCTEYGWWQTAADQKRLRSARVNVQSFRKLCSNVFGEGVWPDIQRKNTEYGALSFQPTNLLLVNGVQDPWKWAGIMSSNRESVIAKVADCPNCAHCVDLYTPSTSDSAELKKIRDQQYLLIQTWIQDYWRLKGTQVRTTKNILQEYE